MKAVLVLNVFLAAGASLFAQEYFPQGGFDPAFSQHLRELREPSLWELSQRDPKAEVYRIVLLRPSGGLFSARIVTRASGSGWVHSFMRSGRSSTRNGMSWLTKTRVRTFIAAVDRTDFESLPPHDAAAESGGGRWLIERVKDGQYHAIERKGVENRSDPADPVRSLCMLTLKLGRFRMRGRSI